MFFKVFGNAAFWLFEPIHSPLGLILAPSWADLVPKWAPNGPKGGPKSVQKLVQKLTPKNTKKKQILSPKMEPKNAKMATLGCGYFWTGFLKSS